MKRIGICLSGNCLNGGTYQYVLSLLKAFCSFPETQYKIMGICLEKDWEKICEGRGIDYYFTENTTDKFSIINMIIIKRNVTYGRKISQNYDLLDVVKNKIDITIFPLGEPYSYLLPTKNVGVIHDLMHRYERRFKEAGGLRNYQYRECIYKRIAKYTEIILTDSQIGKKQLEESYLRGKEKSNIFPLPYIPPDYIFEDKEIEADKLASANLEWKKIELQLPSQYLFYPAQFWKHKNHKHLLEALVETKRAIPNIQLVLVGGEKNAYEEVCSFIEKYDLAENVIILGYVNNYSMIQLYKKARGLIMPSYFGPTNIPQLEAFYLGCPVAVANVYGVLEQVGDAALLFAPDSVKEIKNCMEKLWNNETLRNQLIERGYKWSRNWGEKQFGTRLLEIINLL